MSNTAFQFAPMPYIHFGWGVRHSLISHLQKQYSGRIVLITGSFLSQKGQFGQIIRAALTETTRHLDHFIVSGEPSPELVDDIVSKCKIDTQLVIGIGGGSVLDAAKTIAGLIPSQTSVMDYLEGVGMGKAFNVTTCPFIAVPTTAGTGSETTKNAVLSSIGKFKKSFRDNKLLAKEAWLDPELLKTCPREVLFATGMDAFTQLLESYTTPKSNPITDALAWQGMSLFKGAFENINSADESKQQQGYSNLMLAASLSGTTLANAGLGAVHGLAGPIGAFFDAPHGIVCAKLLAPITSANIDVLLATDGGSLILNKYKQIGKLFNPSLADEDILAGLLKTLKDYALNYTPQGLSQYGLSLDNIQPVISSCRSGSMLANPVLLSDEQLMQAISHAL
ncbi:iron-containing alcohol dehydrogenase [Colwellia hornerae]|uniref:Iron-containing alcohol dehydrogenase n=1 Tax=Colwellia hornerae TaxID=89402 RepID=A0A5C6Q5A6_9GAMM|nr:iron-containing alcohol dehydrogenase [Colwellia hornerae]TWX59483.1 iron-containing alcohol dehydrogenase [Colwellia hornerae]TWX62853.1 iron-containing alcohol dehydrogenase [Colwellia hornerae]TWX64046.1 iron-containing alcohol dehydrogenase [Colwellia hornerae]